MSTATKKAYTPRILQPKLRQQAHGITAYLVESHTPNDFHFVWMQPSGYMRCDCQAAKYGRDCSHKQALKAKLEAAPHGLSEEAFVEQQQEAERLANLPREFAGVETSEEQKVQKLERQAEETVTARRETVIHPNFQKKLDDTIFPTMASRAEKAVLQRHEPEEFSIYAAPSYHPKARVTEDW